LWVNQEPFRIRAGESIDQLYGRPTQIYAIGRLKLFNDGEFCRRLDGRAVRLVVAGGRNLPSGSNRVPAAVPYADVVYFYFFSLPLNPSNLPPADETLQAHPVWRIVAKTGGRPSQPGGERPTRDAESWLTTIGKDVLVLAGKRETLEQILQRMSGSSGLLALPETLPEWAQVNRRSSFWGLRHYSESAKAESGELNYSVRPSADAFGLTVAFEASNKRIEIRYLSATPLLVSTYTPDVLSREFKVDQPQPGVWRLVSNLNDRGDSPAHIAFMLLGFGIV
jgi:hypothetical protein